MHVPVGLHICHTHTHTLNNQAADSKELLQEMLSLLNQLHTDKQKLNSTHSNTHSHNKPTQAPKPCKSSPVHAGTNKKAQRAG